MTAEDRSMSNDIGLRASGPGDRLVCPRCGAAIEPVPIAYGYPTQETFEAADRGEVRLGGCIVEPESPDFVCPACDALLPFVADRRTGRPVVLPH
jgi:hypothetical protein